MNSSWAAYTGLGQFLLIVVLAVATVSLIVVAARLPSPVPGPKATGGAVAFLVAAWLLAIGTFIVAAIVYVLQAREVHLTLPATAEPRNAGDPRVRRCIVRGRGRVDTGQTAHSAGERVSSAPVQGPMVFELPFDLIVMARTTAIQPAPAFVHRSVLPAALLDRNAHSRPRGHQARSSGHAMDAPFAGRHVRRVSRPGR